MQTPTSRQFFCAFHAVCVCVCVGVRVGGRSRSSTGRSTVGEIGLCSRFLCESSTYSYMLQFQLANLRMCACVTRWAKVSGQGRRFASECRRTGANYPDNPINNDHDSLLAVNMHVDVGVNMDVDMDMVVHVDLSPSSHFLCSSKDPLEALVSPFMGGGGDPRGWHSGVGGQDLGPHCLTDTQPHKHSKTKRKANQTAGTCVLFRAASVPNIQRGEVF